MIVEPLLDAVPPNHVGPPWFLVLGAAVLGVGYLGAMFAMVYRALRLRSAGMRHTNILVERANWALSPGPNRVVYGRVDLDPGPDDIAVRVDIVQQVLNKTYKNSQTHEWKEESRTVIARPFYLTRDGMDPVYVEPAQNALVVDELETLFPKGMHMRRIRRADVRSGEMFYVYGDLHVGNHPRAQNTAYRGAGTGFILKPPRRDHMLFATGAIEKRFKDRIRTLLLAAPLLFIHFLVFHVTWPFATLAFAGEPDTAEVLHQHTYVTRNKNSTTTHYVLTVVARDGQQVSGEVPIDTYVAVERKRGTSGSARVPITRVPGLQVLTELGAYPHVSIWTLTGNIFLAALALGGAYALYSSKYAWYDRKKVNEAGGTGHWTDMQDQDARKGR
jgi:hypothetical protein